MAFVVGYNTSFAYNDPDCIGMPMINCPVDYSYELLPFSLAYYTFTPSYITPEIITSTTGEMDLGVFKTTNQGILPSVPAFCQNYWWVGVDSEGGSTNTTFLKFHGASAEKGWYGTYETKILFTNPTATTTYLTNPVHFTGTYTVGFTGTSTVLDNYDKILIEYYDEYLSAVVGTHTILLPDNFHGTNGFDYYQNLSSVGATTLRTYFINSSTTEQYSFESCVQFPSTGYTSTTTQTINSCNPFSKNLSTLFLNPDFSMSDCLGDAMSWLFTPTQAVMQSFIDIKDLIESKPPFGYFAIIKDSLDGINATGTATTSVDSIVLPDYLKNTVFTPIKTGLNVLIWFIVLVFLFNRLKHIQL